MKQLNHDSHQANPCKEQICILLNDFHAPQNVGGIFRLSDALGVHHIYLCGSTPQLPNRKIAKTACATERIIPSSYHEDAIAVIQQLKEDGYLILALEICDESKSIIELKINPQQKVCLVPGAEKWGVKQEILDLADEVYHIKMIGEKSSMNVVSATAIFLHKIAQIIYND